ncbi:MAG: hypothetical protein ACSLFD_02100 [Solirubrobacterales bacterium]
MKKLTILLTLLLASMAMVAAGCGDSDDDSGPSKDEYIAQADKICEEGNADIAKIGEQLGANATKEETAALVESDLLPELESRAKELEGLERPSADEDELESYYQDLDDGISTIADDPEGVITGQQDPFEASDKAAQEYGFKVCGADA